MLRLSAVFTALFYLFMTFPLAGQNAPAQQPAAPATPPAKPAAPAQQHPPQQNNPFENVPQAPTQPAPQPPPAQPQPAQPQPAQPAQPQQPTAQPPLQTPQAPVPTPQPQANGQVIKAIEFRGARRVPTEMLQAMILTKRGDIYSEEAIRRDFMRLWNSSRFDDIRVETAPDPTGGIDLIFIVTERRIIRTINYEGLHSVSVSEILDRFKERKVGLVVESQYDPNKVQRAAVVLKEFLAERGRQYATVDPVIEQIPPSSLKVTFNVKEGPKVKVGTITVTGNKAESSRWVIGAMQQLKPIGIPHSIIFEDLFAKTFDADKLDFDREKIREAYQDKGYFAAKVLDEPAKIVPRGGRGWRLPLIRTQQPGIFADITLPIEEGQLHHLDSMTFTGVKLFREPSVLMGAFGMKKGDVFSTDKLRKGLENLRKIYGGFGYIDFVPEPDFGNPTGGQVDLTINCDEGKQFFIRRIDFSGNTTTRDKVIRRELLLDEGDMFNSNLWDVSILRLNQLGYFEPLKKEDAADIKRNPDSNTVDITLKVRERGKNSIGLNGGVSGIAGSFVGFNYSTNNFLGLGETLSLSTQLGTIMRSASFGFTEPYLFDHPIQASFTVYFSRYDFNQARQASILTGQNLIGLYNQLGPQNLLNYVQNSRGFRTGLSYQLHRSFWRTGITYGYDISNVATESSAATQYFDYINFSGVYGPNSLNGIDTSSITPSLSYDTVNHPITPTGGKRIFFSTAFAGSVLGGNVNTVRPTVDITYYHPSPIHRSNTLAFHFTTDIISGYGGKDVPPFSRSFMGGENDIRGFDWWSITPLAFIPSSSTANVYNSDGTQRMQKVVSNGSLVSVPVTMAVPTYQLITPGGDWRTYGNFEYRIPIVGNTVTLAPFADAGVNRILQPGQLSMDPQRVMDLQDAFPGAGFTGKVQVAPGTQKFRMSTGLELQVMLPVVQAPFRIYFAYNPSVVREYLTPPVVADRTLFPNQETYYQYLLLNAQEYPYFERRTLFRFTIGRTF